MNLLENNYLFLELNGVYKREEIVWENYQYDEQHLVPFHIKIVNTSGYTLLSEIIRLKEQPIQLPGLQPGLYFVLVQNQAFSEAQKLIIRQQN